jgi:hypothetical protein
MAARIAIATRKRIVFMMITLSQKPREHLGPAVDGVDSCGLAIQVPKPARPDKKFLGGAGK